MTLFNRFLSDTEGATAIEYALIASLIAVAVISAISFVGTQVNNVFSEVGNGLR
jgi:pilus assembly protein Flp/PilA